MKEKKTVEQLINLDYDKPELVDLNLIKAAKGISGCLSGSGDAVGCGAGAGVLGGSPPPPGP